MHFNREADHNRALEIIYFLYKILSPCYSFLNTTYRSDQLVSRKIFISIYLPIYLYLFTHPTLFSKVVSNDLSMAQCFSLVLIFLRVYPSKGLVTQQPDERLQISCLLVGMAQRRQSQRRETRTEIQETGFAFQLADFGQVTSSFLMPVSQQYNEEGLPQFSSFSCLLSLRARASHLLPLTSRL